MVVREHGPPGRKHLRGGSRRNPKLPQSHRQTGLLPWELHHASTNSVPVRFSHSLALSAHQGTGQHPLSRALACENTAQKKKKKKKTRRKLFFFIGIERFKFLLSSGWKSVAISLWGVLHGCDLGDRCRTPCYPMVFPLSPHLKNTRLTRNYTHTWRTSLAVRFRVCFADDAPDGCKVPRAPIRDGCSADGPTGIS